MYESQHLELARLREHQIRRSMRVDGVRRGARLIQLDIRRSRRASHAQ